MSKSKEKLTPEQQVVIDAQIADEVGEMFNDLSEPGIVPIAHKEDQDAIDRFKSQEPDEDTSNDEDIIGDQKNISGNAKDQDETDGDQVETEDDLLDYSRRKLETLAKENKLQFDAKISDRELRDLIRGFNTNPDKQKADLLNWFNEQALNFQNQQNQTPKESEKPKEVSQIPMATLNISEDDYAAAMTSKDAFSKILNSNAQIAQQQTIQQLIPVINNYVTQQISMAQMVNDFYSDNPDLKPFKNIVTFAAQSIHSKDPGKSFVDILKDTETFLRAKLNLKKEQKKVQSQQKDKPSFMATKTTSRKAPIKDKEMNSIEKEIWDLVSAN